MWQYCNLLWNFHSFAASLDARMVIMCKVLYRTQRLAGTPKIFAENADIFNSIVRNMCCKNSTPITLFNPLHGFKFEHNDMDTPIPHPVSSWSHDGIHVDTMASMTCFQERQRLFILDNLKLIKVECWHPFILGHRISTAISDHTKSVHHTPDSRTAEISNNTDDSEDSSLDHKSSTSNQDATIATLSARLLSSEKLMTERKSHSRQLQGSRRVQAKPSQSPPSCDSSSSSDWQHSGEPTTTDSSDDPDDGSPPPIHTNFGHKSRWDRDTKSSAKFWLTDSSIAVTYYHNTTWSAQKSRITNLLPTQNMQIPNNFSVARGFWHLLKCLPWKGFFQERGHHPQSWSADLQKKQKHSESSSTELQLARS